MTTIKNIEIDTDNFNCPICLEIFDTPVSIACGHTFCKSCISISIRKKERCPTCQYPTCCVPIQNIIINGIIMKLYPEQAKLEKMISDIIHVIASVEYKKFAKMQMKLIQLRANVKGICSVIDIVDPLMNHVIMGSNNGNNMKYYKTFLMNNDVYVYRVGSAIPLKNTLAQLIQKNPDIFTSAESAVKIFNDSKNSKECSTMNLKRLIKSCISNMPNLLEEYGKLYARLKNDKSFNNEKAIDISGMLNDRDEEVEEDDDDSTESNEREVEDSSESEEPRAREVEDDESSSSS